MSTHQLQPFHGLNDIEIQCVKSSHEIQGSWQYAKRRYYHSKEPVSEEKQRVNPVRGEITIQPL